MIHDGSNDRQANSSVSLQSAMDIHSTTHDHNLWFNRKEDGNYTSDNNGLSVKWKSFQMKLMNCNSGPADNKTSNSVRVCSDCNTTTTPLWRSGPRGPKSLCNACGIRQRKARRAMEAAAAANGAAIATDATSMKIKVHNKREKKSRKSLVAQYKKHQFQVTSDYNSPYHHHHHQSQKKLCFKEFALRLNENSALQRVFPQDVEEAAILLMELSCGLIHS
ncbi:hypothetical protein CRYUN_Cryun03dG0032700 [Craigia yunnanensis]